MSNSVEKSFRIIDVFDTVRTLITTLIYSMIMY